MILNGQKFESPKVAIGYRRSEQVELLDESLIPKEFFKTPAPTVDKAAIRDQLKKGTPVPGAALTQVYNLQIK